MKHTLILAMAIGTLIASGMGRCASAQEPSSPTLGGNPSLAITKFYDTPLSGVGEFPGRVVRLSSCASSSVGSSEERCSASVHGLVVDGDQTIHPLLPSTDEVAAELESAASQSADVR